MSNQVRDERNELEADFRQERDERTDESESCISQIRDERNELGSDAQPSARRAQPAL